MSDKQDSAQEIVDGMRAHADDLEKTAEVLSAAFQGAFSRTIPEIEKSAQAIREWADRIESLLNAEPVAYLATTSSGEVYAETVDDSVQNSSDVTFLYAAPQPSEEGFYGRFAAKLQKENAALREALAQYAMRDIARTALSSTAGRDGDGAARTDDGATYYNPEQMRHHAEEHEACMMAMDKAGVPRHSPKDGATFSLWGRACHMVAATEERLREAEEERDDYENALTYIFQNDKWLSEHYWRIQQSAKGLCCALDDAEDEIDQLRAELKGKCACVISEDGFIDEWCKLHGDMEKQLERANDRARSFESLAHHRSVSIDNLMEELERYKADGWQLVPMEPPEELLRTMEIAHQNSDHGFFMVDAMRDAYRAMIKAAKGGE